MKHEGSKFWHAKKVKSFKAISVEKETEAAFLFLIAQPGNHHEPWFGKWIPKSICKAWTQDDGSIAIEVPEWFT